MKTLINTHWPPVDVSYVRARTVQRLEVCHNLRCTYPATELVIRDQIMTLVCGNEHDPAYQIWYRIKPGTV